ncbi:MAG: TSUP family transporter [Sphingomonadales bacterium]
MVDPLQLLLIFAAIALGSLAKGVAGFGLPLVAMPILAAIIGVEHAVVVMTLPSLVSNGWLVWANRHAAPPAKTLALFLVAAMLGGVVGTWLLAVVSEQALMLVLALWLAVYLAMLAWKPDFRLPWPQAFAPVFGICAGALQGATGISAPIVASYLSGIGLAKDGFVFSLALAFTLIAVSQGGAMLHYDLFTATRLFEGLAALVPVMVFLRIGVRWGRSISVDLFRKIMMLLFFILEGRLIYAGLWG